MGPFPKDTAADDLAQACDFIDTAVIEEFGYTEETEPLSDKWDKCAFAKADSDADRVEIFFSERGSEFFLAEPAAGNPKVSEATPADSRYPGVDTIAGPSPIEGEALIDTVKGAFTVTVISMS